MIADRQEFPRELARSKHGFDLVVAQGQRLFDEDMLARRQRRDGLPGVQVVPSRDDDRRALFGVHTACSGQFLLKCKLDVTNFHFDINWPK